MLNTHFCFNQRPAASHWVSPRYSNVQQTADRFANLPVSVFLHAEAPVLLTQRRVVSVFEGSDVQLTCSLRDNYLPVNEITWFNNQGVSVQDRSKYLLLRTSAWANLTVKDTDVMQDSGEYRCSTSNAVGGADINVTLVVKSKNLFHPESSRVLSELFSSAQTNKSVLLCLGEGFLPGLVHQHHPGSRCQDLHGTRTDSNRHLPVQSHACELPHHRISFCSKDSRYSEEETSF
uniref:Ig-like domain-containing protein n=1 Tax=Nothobranchius furzeri TaxID=105023 RepID=A0A8C6P721_NOTFU